MSSRTHVIPPDEQQILCTRCSHAVTISRPPPKQTQYPTEPNITTAYLSLIVAQGRHHLRQSVLPARFLLPPLLSPCRRERHPARQTNEATTPPRPWKQPRRMSHNANFQNRRSRKAIGRCPLKKISGRKAKPTRQAKKQGQRTGALSPHHSSRPQSQLQGKKTTIITVKSGPGPADNKVPFHRRYSRKRNGNEVHLPPLARARHHHVLLRITKTFEPGVLFSPLRRTPRRSPRARWPWRA